MGSQPIQLLFFDTFSHEIVEELNLDLVQFPNPVIVEEVRVIPLGARVQANFPGGVRLGATNPAQFNLEFFVNDLSKSGASTFERLGTMQYSHDGSINMETEKKIPTDGLVLRGFYNAITLAVYGTLSKYSAEQLALQSSTRHQAENALAAQAAAAAKESVPPKDVVQEKPIKVEPAPVKGPSQALEPWHYPQQQVPQRQPSPQLPVMNDIKVEAMVITQPPVSPEKSSYPRSDRPYKERERERHRLSPLPYDAHQRRRSRSGSRGREWKDWRTSDSVERWQSDRHRGRRSRDRSRSPVRDHGGYRRSRSPSPARSPSLRSCRSPSLQKHPRLKSNSPPPRLNTVRPVRNSISPARSHHSRTRSRSPIILPAQQHIKETLIEVKSPQPQPDVLDDVSDISDGDIPDVPEKEVPENVEKSKPKQPKLEPIENLLEVGGIETEPLLTPLETKKPSRPEDIEEISDEEAEWSDEGDPIFPMDFEVNFGDDWEYPVKEFDYFASEIKPATFFNRQDLPSLEPGVLSNLHEKLNQLSILQAQQANSDWVEVIEELTPHLQTILKDDQHHQLLLQAAARGLDLEVSVAQPLPAYKIRHLKSGLKFTLALLECSTSAAEDLLSAGLMTILLSLFDEPNMAVSLKLLIVRIFDLSLNCPNGMDYCLGRKVSNSEDPAEKPIYNQLIRSLTLKMPLRLKHALSALISKVNLVQVLETLRELSEQSARWVDEKRDEPLPTDICNTIVACLQQTLHFYCKAKFIIAQPLKYLPTRSQYEFNDSLFCDPTTGFFALWDSNQTLATLNELLIIGSNLGHPGITGSILKILFQLLKDTKGLLYLCSHPDETNGIIKVLMSGESLNQYQTYGQYLLNAIVTFSSIDQLNSLCQGKSRKEMETMEVLETIQTLHSLTLSNQGKLAVVSVLAKGDLLDILTQLVQHSPVTEDCEIKRDMKKSAIRAYASELLILVVRMSEDVEYLKKFSNILINIGAQDESSRLFELTSWLGPFNEPSMFTLEGFGLVSEIIKKNLDKLSSVSPELMTAVRILRMLCKEPMTSQLETDLEEQNHKYTLMTVFSQDLLDQYLQILTKICSYHEQPMMHLVTFFGNGGFLLMSTIKPMVETIKNVLGFLIKSQRADFKDFSPISALLKVYSLSRVVGPSSLAYNLSQKVCQDVLSILALYTVTGVWQEMVKEVLQFTQEAPHTFTPGLEILSQLLPPPLPMQTPSSLTDSEVDRLTTVRNLWSVQIFTLETQICQMIETLCGSSVESLQTCLQRVTIQLADLSAPTAVSVVKAVLDAFKKSIADNVIMVERISDFLQALLDQATTKAAFLSITLDQKEYQDIQTLFSQILGSEVGKVWSASLQETIACSIQALLDPEISLQPMPEQETEIHLANSLPVKDHFLIYFSAMLDHLAVNASGPSLAPIFRTMAMANEYEFGQCHQRALLQRRPTLLPEFVSRFAAVFSKDNQDQVQCLSAMTMFLQTLAGQAGSTKVDFSEVFQFDKENPIRNLCEKLLEEKSEDESGDIFRSVAETLANIATVLETTSTQSARSILEEDPELPKPDPLVQQFQQRPVFIDCEIVTDSVLEEDLPDFIGLLRSDDKQVDALIIQPSSVDLIELVETYLPSDFNLVPELQKICNEKLMEKRKKKTKKSLLEAKALQNKNLISTFKAGGPVPTLGGNSRGFQRSGQRLDAFRSRPPNTSRPPSLHVDDFLVLQSRGQQPTGPTGYNKQTLKAAQELFAQREAKKGAVGFREATKEPVFSGNNRNMNPGNNPGNGRQPTGLGPSKMSFRGGNRARGGFNRERLSPRDWSPPQRNDYGGNRLSNDGHFSGGRSRPGGGGSNMKDRKIKIGSRDDRPRHIRSSMDR